MIDILNNGGTMTRAHASIIKQKIQELIQANFPEYSVTIGTARFGTNDLNLRDISLVERSIQGGRPELDWTNNYRKYNLERDWLGKSFQCGSKTMTIIGLSPKRRHYPVMVTINGATRLVSAETVKTHLTSLQPVYDDTAIDNMA
jgi:hypothetical protein